MSGFSDIIPDALYIADACNIAVTGAEKGGLAPLLGDYARRANGRLTCIDVSPSPSFLQWVESTDSVQHIGLTSHDAISALPDIDAWIIDSDYNWYSVYNDLVLIEAQSQRNARPLLAFVHHIGWPCARRDLYFAPERIPAAFRHDHDFHGLVLPGNTALVPRPPESARQCFAFSSYEGGPRNGVLTAIEDFIGEPTPGREFCLAEVPGLFGLGILFDVAAPWSSAMADLVAPFHCNKLLATLETSRLATYLRVREHREAERSDTHDRGQSAG